MEVNTTMVIMIRNMKRIINNAGTIKKVSAIVILACLIIGLTSCNNGLKENKSNKESTREVYAMDTYMTLKAYGENGDEALDKCVSLIEEMDNMFSIGVEDSYVSEVNKEGSGYVNDDFENIIKEALYVYENTDGAFDITVYPLMEAWGFAGGEKRVPSDDEIESLLEKVDSSKINYNEEENYIELEEGVKIDFGGIAKGYASNKVIDLLKEEGVISAVVSLGGNVQCLGTKTDGSYWNIAIEDPDDTEKYLGSIKVKDKAVITSGGYERYFEENGKTYHHILDPFTGKPANNGVKSVTIISDDGMLSDALSTALFVMGTEKACDYYRKHNKEFDFIIKTDDNGLIISQGIKDSFNTDYDAKIVECEK